MNYMAAVWLITAVVLGIIESITVALVSIWMAIGAFAAAVFAFFGFSTAVQVLVFAAVSALMLILTAPLSKRFRQSKKVSTNADRLIGQEGVVLRRVDPIENKGQIKVMGQIWSAEGVCNRTSWRVSCDVGRRTALQSAYDRSCCKARKSEGTGCGFSAAAGYHKG